MALASGIRFDINPSSAPYPCHLGNVSLTSLSHSCFICKVRMTQVLMGVKENKALESVRQDQELKGRQTAPSECGQED